jgi:molybdopterin-guanine dinucleotide biosynthesis protein A
VTGQGVTVAIQAGGKSSRMGQDKALIAVHGRTLLERVLARVHDLGDELILIANRPEVYAPFNLPCFPDLYPDHGPLAGIYTALAHARRPHVLVVACDMPWLNPALLRHLISLREEGDAVVPCWGRFPEPLHAVYSQACRAPIRTCLENGRLKATAFYDQVRVHLVERKRIAAYDPQGRSFTNVNTPEELARLRRQPDAY